ncbi:hypothetical protein D3C85_1929310 [compost metagenome]
MSEQGAELIGKVAVAPRVWLPEALARLSGGQLRQLADGLDDLLAVMEVSDRQAASKPLPFTE